MDMKTNFVVRQLILAFFLTLTTLVSGCGSTSHSVPASYTLQFQAHPQVNASAPLKVRVLLLKSDATFMSADFWSLQNNAGNTLGVTCSTAMSSSYCPVN
jgi:type VI secretion system protein VasD